MPGLPRPIPSFLLRHLAFVVLLLGFLAVVSPGLFVRVYPLYGDEIDLAHCYVPAQVHEAESLFSVETTHFGMHNLDFLARAWFLKGGGWPEGSRDIAMRVFNLLMAVGLLTAIYGFCNAHWGRPAGIVTAFLAAFSHYNLFHTINGCYYNETALAILLSVACLVAALRTPHRGRAILGVCFSAAFATLAFMLYFTGRLLIGAIGLLWWWASVQRNQPRSARHGLLVLWIVAFGLLAWKPIDSVLAHPEKGIVRQRQVSIFYDENLRYLRATAHTQSTLYAVAWNQARSILAYFQGPNSYHAYETPAPYLDRFSGILLLLGILIAVRNRRELHYAVLPLVWLFFSIIPCGLTTKNSPPYSPRAHVGMLFAWILASLPLVWLLLRSEWRSASVRRLVRPVVSLVVAGVLTGLAIRNIHLYYDFHNDLTHPGVAQWRLFDDLARSYERLRPTTTFIAAESPTGLLRWSTFPLTHGFSPGEIVEFRTDDGPPGEEKLELPVTNHHVVVVARGDRTDEARAAIRNAGLGFREIREIIPEVPEEYSYLILGHPELLRGQGSPPEETR